jgi:transposase
LQKLKKYSIIADMETMNGLTIREIAEMLKIEPKAVTARLLNAGIKPKQKAGRTNLYAPSVVEAIRNVPGKGRPRKPAPEPAKLAKKPKK